MDDQGTQAHALMGSGRASGQGSAVFQQAAAMLQERHQVTRSMAFDMLVHRAGEACSSVREVADAVIADAF